MPIVAACLALRLYNRPLIFLRKAVDLAVIPVDDFSHICLAQLAAAQGWQQQYKLIIDWGKTLAPKPAIRTPAFLLQGCELPVWLAHERRDGRHYFALDADSSVIKGLAALVVAQVQGCAQGAVPVNISAISANLVALGLEKHLTPSRNNGLRAIVEQVQSLLDEDADGSTFSR